MNLKFRDLRADEIDCRPATITANGISLLLYKDARVDMDILDETLGVTGWQRRHCRENANCIISIWDDEKKQWIEKEDTGTESNTEKEKGLASDSFKRAAFNIGIGRELYTAPFIWITSDQATIKETGKTDAKGKMIYTTNDKFYVSAIEIENKTIVSLTIANQKTGEIVYEYKRADYDGKIGKDKLELIKKLDIEPEKAKEILKQYGYEKSSDIKIKDFAKVYAALKGDN